MKRRICTAVLAACLIPGLARGADPSLPAIIDYADTAPDAARAGEQLALLHNWPGTLVFGFDGRGRPLVYDSARLVFEVHDLAAPEVPARGWKNPDADTVISGAFSPDRRTLATVHSAGNRESRVQARQSRIQLWNIETGEPIERSYTPSDAGYVAFSPDGKSLFGAALDSSGKVTVWDAASGQIRQVLSLPPPQPHFSYSGVHFSPTGRHLAARINFGGAVSLWEVDTWKPTVESSQPVVCLAVSPDWKAALAVDLLGVHGQANIRLVGLADPGTQAKAPAPLPAGTENTLIAGAFSPDGRRLACSHRSGVVRIWDVATGRVESTLAVNAGTVMRMGFSPDGRRLMTYGLPPGRSPGEVQLWDVTARRPLGMPESVPGIFWDFQFDPDSRYLVVSFLPGDDRVHAKVWRLPAGDAPPNAPPPTPHAGSIDVRDVGFKTPECVVWDKAGDVYLVSNIHGHPLDKDDNGFISRVRPDGTVEALKWIDGATEGVTLHAPKGMVILNDVLWVADIDVLRGFDRSTGRALKEVPVPRASQMNKILSFPNALGVPAGCLVTDTPQWRPEGPDTMCQGTSFLHIIDLDHGEVTTTPKNPWVRPGRVRGGTLEADLDLQSAHPFGQVTGAAMTPQGFGLVAWDRPWAYNIESGYDLDKVGPIRLPRGQSYDVIVLPPVGGGEGGAGERWLISSWAGRCLYAVQLNDLAGATVSEWLSDIRAPAKLGYDVKRNRVLIPLYLDDALMIRPGPNLSRD